MGGLFNVLPLETSHLARLAVRSSDVSMVSLDLFRLLEAGLLTFSVLRMLGLELFVEAAFFELLSDSVVFFFFQMNTSVREVNWKTFSLRMAGDSRPGNLSSLSASSRFGLDVILDVGDLCFDR